jgi:hypothetical protein
VTGGCAPSAGAALAHKLAAGGLDLRHVERRRLAAVELGDASGDGLPQLEEAEVAQAITFLQQPEV